jgi:hypothetical protein
MWINQTSREQFVDFLLEAKRATYAGQGDEATVTPLVPGSKQLEYRDGDYLYRDIYFGMAYFAGQEVVFHREQTVWSMSYARGVMPLSRDSSDTRGDARDRRTSTAYRRIGDQLSAAHTLRGELRGHDRLDRVWHEPGRDQQATGGVR